MSVLFVAVTQAFAVQLVSTRRLTSDPRDQYNPVISGDHVVYTDNRNGSTDIYLYDLVSGTEIDLTPDSADQVLNDVSGDFVVYTDYRTGDGDIYAYHIPSAQSCRLTFDAHNQTSPSVSNDLVVYQDDRGADTDVWGFDLTVLDPNDFSASCAALAAGQFSGERAFVTKPDRQVLPKTSGRYIVWEDFRTGAPRVFAYDRQTDTEVMMPEHGKNQLLPSVDGARVVYIEADDTSRDVSYYDLDTQTFVQLTSDAHRQNYPSISGNYVAWEDDRNGNLDIFLYDLTNGSVTPITNDPGDQYLNDIDGTRIVFTDASAGNLDIVYAEIKPDDPPPPSQCDAGSGAVVASVPLDSAITRREFTVWPFLWKSFKGGHHTEVSDHERLVYEIDVDRDVPEAMVSMHVQLIKSKLPASWLKKGFENKGAIVIEVNGTLREWDDPNPAGTDAWVDIQFAQPITLYKGKNMLVISGKGYGHSFLKYRPISFAGGGTLTITERPPCLPDPSLEPRCADPQAEVFFTKTYLRKIGAPETVSDDFTVGKDGPAVLCVSNGDADGQMRASAAFVKNNGYVLLGPDAFGPAVATIAAPMLVKESNRLEVELRSVPGAFITLRVIRDKRASPPEVVIRTGCHAIKAGDRGESSLWFELCLLGLGLRHAWRRSSPRRSA